MAELSRIESTLRGENDSLISIFTGTFVLATFACCLATLYVSLLATGTTYRILVNETAWEAAKRNRITYLRPYARRFLPFNKGLRANVEAVFCTRGRISEQLPIPLDDQTLTEDNNPCPALAALCGST